VTSCQTSLDNRLNTEPCLLQAGGARLSLMCRVRFRSVDDVASSGGVRLVDPAYYGLLASRLRARLYGESRFTH